MSYRTNLVEIVTDTVKAQNVDVLTADFQMKRAGNICRISVSSTAVLLRLVPSEGSAISLGTPAAGTMTTYEFALDTGRTYNLQTNNASGVTVDFLCVQEVAQ